MELRKLKWLFLLLYYIGVNVKWLICHSAAFYYYYILFLVIKKVISQPNVSWLVGFWGLSSLLVEKIHRGVKVTWCYDNYVGSL